MNGSCSSFIIQTHHRIRKLLDFVLRAPFAPASVFACKSRVVVGRLAPRHCRSICLKIRIFLRREVQDVSVEGLSFWRRECFLGRSLADDLFRQVRSRRPFAHAEKDASVLVREVEWRHKRGEGRGFWRRGGVVNLAAQRNCATPRRPARLVGRASIGERRRGAIQLWRAAAEVVCSPPRSRLRRRGDPRVHESRPPDGASPRDLLAGRGV